MPPVTHAKLSPSASSRWLYCTASVALCAQVPQKESTFFANEGTAAHELAEKSLKNKKKPQTYIGETIKVGDELFQVTEDMADTVSLYIMEVMKYASKKYNPTIKDVYQIEQKVNLDWLGFPNIYGTVDCLLPDRAKRVLHIFDLKYGMGEPVSAIENRQLMIYALGGLGLFCVDDFDFVHLHIIQPRCYDSGISDYEITVKDLLGWAENTLAPACKEIATDPKYCASAKTCKWCPAKHLCPELSGVYTSVANIKSTTKELTSNINLPEVKTLTDEQIATIIANKKLVENFMEEVSTYANAQALEGKKFPGLKLVQGRKGNRTWTDDELVINAFHEKYGEEIFNKKLLTPRQMEAILSPDDNEIAKSMTSQSDGKIYLVSVNEKGKEIEIENQTEALLDELYGK